MKEIVINSLNAHQRADKFVRKFLNEAPLSFIYKVFRKKDVKVNGKWIKESYILCEGDILRIYVTDEQVEEFNKPKNIENIKSDLAIIYEDENILIINKPKGILVHGDINEKRITLSNQVQAYLYKKGEFKNDGKGFIPSPCHRLDRNTSGLIVYAKNVESSQIMMNLLQSHVEIEKYYLLLVDGKTEEEGEINAPLLKDEESGFVKVASIKDGAKSAKTLYKKIDTNGKYSLVYAKLLTGRTHQLRVHFQYIKHPILGDDKYGNFQLNKEFSNIFNYKNQFLHAFKLKFNNIPGKLNYLSDKEFVALLPNKEREIITKLSLKIKMPKDF